MNLVPQIENLPAAYAGMLDRIGRTLPAIQAGADNFYKSASQFKMATLDIATLTPLRTMRQILAECDRTQQALTEAYYKLEKNKVEIERKRRLTSTNAYDLRLWALEAAELDAQNRMIENHMQGAIRKLAYLAAQYEALAAEHPLTEEAFEREEARYHIMTAFKQAWIAANARGGHIDEGNLIYLFDLGIPLAVARAAVMERYQQEQQLAKERKGFTHADTVAWLALLAEKFADCPRQFAAARGLKLLDVLALATISSKHETKGGDRDGDES